MRLGLGFTRCSVFGVMIVAAACAATPDEPMILDGHAGPPTGPKASSNTRNDSPAAWAEPRPPKQVSAAKPTAATSESRACPPDMVLIEGRFCPVVEQACLRWLEPPDKSPFARCAQFAAASACKAERVPLRFCIDRLEAAEQSGMPLSDISWIDAAAFCKMYSKRLCWEREWLFACEGEEMSPYPYGTRRDSSLCNFDNESLIKNGQLIDLRQAVTSNPTCLSAFGVQNMVGNVDEWVVLDEPYVSSRGEKMMSGLKGGWWGPMRDGCRPVAMGHDTYFHELQIGFRCCSDTP